MKKPIFLFSALLLTVSLLISCEGQDLCDAGYTDVDGFCIPDYVAGKTIPENEAFYFHKDYGVISFQDGKWVNRNKEIVSELNN